MSNEMKESNEDREFMAAWDAEIDLEQADELELIKLAGAEQKTARLEGAKANADIYAKLMELTGIRKVDAEKRNEEEFARARDAALLIRARAVEIMKKRAESNALEVRTMVSGIERGK